MLSKLWFPLFFIVLVFFAGGGRLVAEESPRTLAAQEAAGKWLQVVDQGQYAKSWEQASPLFRKDVDKDQWVLALELARSPLGMVQSRKLVEHEVVFDPEKFPQGELMILLYETHFGSVPQTKELLSLICDGKGEWKVLTYQVN